jgi:glutamate decarboxylase
MVYENGAPMPTKAKKSEEVSRYLKETANVIEQWLRTAEEDPDTPVSRFGSSKELRAQVQLPDLAQNGCSDARLMQSMAAILDNSVHPWTGRFVDKLYTAPLTTGPAFEALLTAINANAHIISAAPMLCLAEEACVSALASLCGWDGELADGLTMPGGSSSNTFAIQTALTSLLPMFKQRGIIGVIGDMSTTLKRSPEACTPLIYTGAEAHYSLEKAAIACGLGLNSVVKVPCNVEGDMDLEALDRLLNEAYDNADGEPGKLTGLPLFVNATAGSTVTGSFDRLDRMADVCQKYRALGHRLWLHVDGSWGGPVLFSRTHRRKMRGIEKCDSFTINPHKLLNV